MSGESPAILFLVFNRPETTAIVFEAIRQQRPRRLYCAADGPRPDREDDVANCAHVRTIATQVDWPCELRTLFRDRNLGCRRAVSGAIDWFFEHEEEGIILEDDILPDPSFFPFCAELLARYRNEPRVMHITGGNLCGQWKEHAGSYHFSRFGGIWGWATWRRSWKHYDVDVARWSQRQWQDRVLANYPVATRAKRKAMYDELHAGRIDTWDYQWTLARLAQGGTSIISANNLITNLGFGTGATHTAVAPRWAVNERWPLRLPLRHPTTIACDREFESIYAHLTWANMSYAEYRQQRQAPGETARILLSKALDCLRRRELDACCAYLEQAIELAPDDSGLPGLLGGVLLKRGDYAQARLHFEASLQISPRQPGVLTQLAVTCLRLNDFAGCHRAVREALGLEPRNVEALQLAIECSLAAQLFDEAVQAGEALVQVSPNSTAGHLMLGQAHLGRNDLVGAEKAFRRALALEPKSTSARAALLKLATHKDSRPASEQSEFARFRNLAAEAAPANRLRLAWMEFRTLFNGLINGPVWAAHPATADAWRETRVPRTRFTPIFELIDGLVEMPALPESLTLPEAFALLETIHDILAAELKRVVRAPVERSLVTMRRQRAALPAEYSRSAEVDALCQALEAAPTAINATLLHGSLADGRVAGGFSDADVLCFVARPSAGESVFWSAAQWLFDLNHRLYAVNPCMHHGPMIAFAAELECAAEAAVPSALVRNGVWYKGRFDFALYHDGAIENVLVGAMFEDYFERKHLFAADLASAFDALWWTSSVLLLPLLWQQTHTGESVYKRDCLDERTADLTPTQWELIGRVSEVRRRLGDWIAERLTSPSIELTANPGRIIALNRAALAMTPGDIRALGLNDTLMAEARALWCDLRDRTLRTGFAALGHTFSPSVSGVAWTRAMDDMPRRLTLANYAATRELFLKRCRACVDVVAVFEFGEVGCPGLSDLDFCVVLSDTCNGVPSALVASDLPEEAAYIMGHDPLFVSASMVSELGAYFPLFGARQLLGTPLKLRSSADFPVLVRAAAITWKSLRKYPDDLDGLLRRPSLDVRTVLAFLHSAQHMRRCLQMLECSVDAAIEAACVLDQELRSRFSRGEELSRTDVFRALEACLRTCAPLRRELVGYWRRAAESLPANANANPPTEVDAPRWLQSELGVEPAGRHREDNLPTLAPLLTEYLVGKRRFCEAEKQRGRVPSVYIEGPVEFGRRAALAVSSVASSVTASGVAPIILFSKTDALGDQMLGSAAVARLLGHFPQHRVVWFVRSGIHAIVDLLDGATLWWPNTRRSARMEAARLQGSVAGGEGEWARVTIVPVPLQPYGEIKTEPDAAVLWWAQFAEALGAEIALAGSATVNWVDQWLVAASRAPARHGFKPVHAWQRLPESFTPLLPESHRTPFTHELSFDRGRDELWHLERLAASATGGVVTLETKLAPKKADIPVELVNDLATSVLVAPGAGAPGRSLPPGTSARALAEFLRSTPAYRGCILVEGPGDHTVVAQLTSELHALGVSCRVFQSMPDRLPELVALLRAASLFLCNETAYVHLAACVGTPTVAVWGLGHWPRFVCRTGALTIVRAELACAGCDWSCCFDSWRCVSLIPATAVAAALTQRSQAGRSNGVVVQTIPELVPDSVVVAALKGAAQRAGGAALNGTGESLRARGDSLLRDGDFAGALKCFEAAVVRTPGSVPDLVRVATAQMKLNLGQPLQATLAKILRLDSHNVDAVRIAAEFAVQTGNKAAAIQLYGKLATLQPRHAEVHLTLGRLFVTAGRKTDAVKCFQVALAIDPANGEARSGLQALLPARIVSPSSSTPALAGGN